MGEAFAIEEGIFAIDSLTRLEPENAGKVLIDGSHGGLFPASIAGGARLRAVILSDGGVGKDGAGIGGLAYLDRIVMAAATVAHSSARIGDGGDMARRGVISHVNEAARALGCRPGQSCLAAARLLRAAPIPSAKPPPLEEGRVLVRAEHGEPKVYALDSATIVDKDDVGQIVITGSHGALLAGRAETALKVDCLAALFHDAGVGIDDAGISRLPALDQRGMVAATVAAESARIGDGRSLWETGIISHVNERAAAAGGKPAMTVQAFVLGVIAWHRDRGSALR